MLNNYKIAWSPLIVDHFSSFFTHEWDGLLAAVLKQYSTSPALAAVVVASLQSLFDVATEQARASVESGFMPSPDYTSRLEALEAAANEEVTSDSASALLGEFLKQFLATDRRNSAARSGDLSLGDHFYAAVGVARHRGIIDRMVDDHCSASSYFGASLYAGLVLVAADARASSILAIDAESTSADALLTLAANGEHFAMSAGTMKRLCALRRNADGAPMVVRHLEVRVEPGDESIKVENATFSDCMFGAGSVGLATAVSFERCEFEGHALGRCESTTFSDCRLSGDVLREAYRCIFERSPLRGPTHAVLTGCWFQGQVFADEGSCDRLENCRFSEHRVVDAEIQVVAGDYTAVEFSNCWIGSINPGSRMGTISESTIGAASHVDFLGDVVDIDLTGPVEQCRFGGTERSLMHSVAFGRHVNDSPADFYADYRQQRLRHGVADGLQFGKGVNFRDVAFRCVLRNPQFSGSVAGIVSIWVLSAGIAVERSFVGTDFHALETEGQGMVTGLVGGHITHLDGRVRRVSHSVIDEIGVAGLVQRYEVIGDANLRQKWKLPSAEVLIAAIAGVVEQLHCVGTPAFEPRVGTVSGTVVSLAGCIRVDELSEGGRVTLEQGTDVARVMDAGLIGRFTGGQLGVWEPHGSEQRPRFYYSAEEYGRRDMLDSVSHLFDELNSAPARVV